MCVKDYGKWVDFNCGTVQALSVLLPLPVVITVAGQSVREPPYEGTIHVVCPMGFQHCALSPVLCPHCSRRTAAGACARGSAGLTAC